MAPILTKILLMADQQETAKQVFVAYRQLETLLKERLGYVTAPARLQTYNRILETLKQCFSTDKTFSDAVKHLGSLRVNLDDLPRKMEADGGILLATAHSFIELYLSPEDKKKAIGFHAN
jgi:hypothetical protein